MVSLHLSSQQERVVLGFGLAALLLAIVGIALLLHAGGALVPTAAGLVLLLLGIPSAAIVVAVGFRPLVRGHVSWLVRPVVVLNLLLLAGIFAVVTYRVAVFIVYLVQLLSDLLRYGMPM